MGNTVLWLAHTEELCEQAYTCFRDVWQASTGVCPLLLFRFWGRYTRDLVAHRENLLAVRDRPTVLVSTPQRIAGLMSGDKAGGSEVLADLEATTGLILVDEAHRAAAPTYRRILEHFVAAGSHAALVGLTATPFRHEYAARDPNAGTLELKRLFRNIIEPHETLGEEPRRELQQLGYLARPEWRDVRTTTRMALPQLDNLELLSEQDIEKVDYALKIRADNPTRRQAILEFILPVCAEPDAQIIYFGPSILDAECMAFLLRQRRIKSAFVGGNTRDVTRRQVVRAFRESRIKVLCNCEVLTTGFDAPKVTHVVMARPTVSQVLYEQMVGRGLRGPRFGGTEHCVIIDCEDNYRAERPVLGFRAFREVWGARRRRG